MGVLLLLLLVATVISWYGSKVTILGSIPVLLLGIALGGTDNGHAIIQGAMHAVNGAATFLGKLAD